jgi:hypothetical protein
MHKKNLIKKGLVFIMDVASMVIGIFSGLLGFIPICNYFALLPAIVGLILGIASMMKRSNENLPKGQSIAGVVLNTIAIIMIAIWTIGLAANAPTKISSNDVITTMKPFAPATQQPQATPEVSIPAEYKSAINKCDAYANNMHMSKKGVYKQLISQYGEGFSADAAQYAVDNIVTDWNAHALIKAKTYQSSMSMSASKIHSQLTSEHGEGFTKDEADYAIKHLND